MKPTTKTSQAARTASLALLLGVGALAAAQARGQAAGSETLSGRMAEKTQAFLAGLDEAATGEATTGYDDPERRTWAFGPVSRKGIALGGLSETSMAQLEAILDEALSDKGMDAWHQIRELESVLHERESKPGKPATNRDPDLYWLRVYGEPNKDGRWSVRFEGHHLALHVSFVPGEAPATTPFFIGASPLLNARDKDITVDAFRELRAKTDALLLTLGPKGAALSPGQKPKDVRMGPGKWDLPPAGGADVASLSKDQRQAASALLDCYQELLEPELRDYTLEGAEDCTFAHWGGKTVAEPRAWCLRTSTFALEVCTTTGADHIHALLRDTQRDFGGKAK